VTSEAYAGSEKLAPLVREIGCSHNLVVLERCENLLQREFYLRVTRKSKNVTPEPNAASSERVKASRSPRRAPTKLGTFAPEARVKVNYPQCDATRSKFPGRRAAQ
jgi:hypothetical protein